MKRRPDASALWNDLHGDEIINGELEDYQFPNRNIFSPLFRSRLPVMNSVLRLGSHDAQSSRRTSLWELVALEWFWPLEAVLVHQVLAAFARRHAKRTTRWNGAPQNGARRSVNGAQKEAQVC